MKGESPIPLTPYDGPLEIWRIGADEVLVVGPGPVAFSMSRDAGMETSRRLVRALAHAAGGPTKPDAAAP